MFKKNEIYKKEPMLHEKFIYLTILKIKMTVLVLALFMKQFGEEVLKIWNFGQSSFKDFLKILLVQMVLR